MIVLVCGSRSVNSAGFVNMILDHEIDKKNTHAIIHGNAIGVDQIAGYWAEANKIHEIRVPAQWDRGKGAGIVRNKFMVDLICSYARDTGMKSKVLAIWDGKSRGTKHTIEYARDMHDAWQSIDVSIVRVANNKIQTKEDHE